MVKAQSKNEDTLVRRFIRAFGERDFEALEEIYDEDVVLYTPLSWGLTGREAVKGFVDEFHNANPGLKVTLHDEFYNASGDRACFRLVLHWNNTGTFFGYPPTNTSGTMSETHSVRVRDGQIVEQWVGDNSFQLPHQELVIFGMDFPSDTPDPEPAILSISAPQGT